MGYISASGSPFGTVTPQLWIEIDGFRRTDATIDSVRLASGVAPSTLEVAFPYAFRGDRPARDLARVVVWLDRHLHANPVFVGRFIRSPRTTFDGQAGPRVVYAAADLRWFLCNEPVCLRDYNKPSKSNGELSEVLTARAVAADLHAQYVAHESAISGRTSADILQISLSSFPDVPVGELNAKGEKIGDALQRLVEGLGGGAYRLKVDYHSASSAVLSCYKAGQGFSQRVVIGADQASNEFNQPAGRANVGSGDEGEDASRVVNEVILESPHHYRERAVALGPAFDCSALSELAEYMAAPFIPSGPSVANPLHDPKAQHFARFYEIPEQLDADGVRRRLKVAPELLQPRQEDEFWRDRAPRPFLVYKFSDSQDWRVLFEGFSIKDGRYVELTRRLLGDITESADYDCGLLLDALHKNGGQAYLTNSIEAELDLAPYASGSSDVHLEPAAQGSALSVMPGDPPGTPPGASTLYINTATRKCYLWMASIQQAALAELNDLANGPVRASRRVYFRATNTVGMGETKRAIPSEIYLNAGWISEYPLRVASGKQGSAKVHAVRLSTSDDGAKEVAANWFKLASTGEDLGDFEITEEDWGVDSWTSGGGATVLRDDSGYLEDKAINMALARSGALVSLQYRLPRMPVGYKVGSLLYVNNVQTGANIDEVEYSGFQGNDPVTIIKAFGQ